MTTPHSIGTDGSFPPTHWSAVLIAGQEGVWAEAALSELCRAYWYPLYSHARRSGFAPADAEDLTQGFFEYLLEGKLVAAATPGRGRFRSFMLGSFRNFISGGVAARAAQKRGGKQLIVLDLAAAEARFAQEAVHTQSPDRLFDRHWTMVVLNEAFTLLEQECKRAGRDRLFERLHPFLEGDGDGATHEEVASALGTTSGTIKVTVFRMRQRYRELIRKVVLRTLEKPSDLDEELDHLMAALRD